MTSSAIRESVPAYGFRRPDVAEARAALARVYGDTVDAVWSQVTKGLGIDSRVSTGTDDDLERLIAAMRAHPDPVVGLCAHALGIRYDSYRHLASTHEVMVGAS